MANLATPADVEARWRPLTPAETIVAQTLLDDAWLMLRAPHRFPDLESRMMADEDLTKTVIRILANAVLRVLKNVEGMKQESLDDYSYTREQSVASGLLEFTDDELADLAPDPVTEEPGTAFSFSLLGRC